MEHMKVSSAIAAYPNKFLLLNAIKRNDSRIVELACVVGVCETKREAFAQNKILKMVGVNTFIVPTFDTEESLQIRISGEEYEAEPLLTPSENALIFRQYYGWD